MKQERMNLWPVIGLAAAGIVLNIVLAQLVLLLKLPLYLDSVGTVLAAVLGGPFPGAIVGALSNVVNSVSNSETLYYGVISVLLGITAAAMSRAGLFRRLPGLLLSALSLAIIGGILGSLLTWVLDGFCFGDGTGSELIFHIYQYFRCPMLTAQITGDFMIDLLDKLITVLLVALVIRWIPRRIIQLFPMGNAYLTHDAQSFRKALPNHAGVRRRSLSISITMLLLGSAVILSVVSVSITSVIYTNMMNARFIRLDQGAVSMVQSAVDAQKVDDFLAQGEEAEGYRETKEKLAEIKESFPDITYVYVYQIQEDGCHVVFDLDTPTVQGEAAGAVVAFDTEFQKYVSALLAGEDIPPVIEKGQYGWLLTVYEPIRDYHGTCVAYAAADISMNDVIKDRYVFIVKMISLLSDASITIIAFTLWYARRRLVEPIDSLATVTSRFAYENEAQRQENASQLKTLDISTGDEIENLFHAVSKTTEDVGSYIAQIKEYTDNLKKSTETIAKMQDNIILSFADMVENRDENTGNHIRRTADYVAAIGGRMLRDERYPSVLTEEYLANMIKSAPLHDIGKIKVPDEILNKPGRLTAEEFNVMKTHTTEGAGILRRAMAGIADSTYLSMAIDMAQYHHEWWNGTGYPTGIAGEDIPLCARVMAVADVLDALLSRRSYKSPLPFDEALKIIREESGTHFDPSCVDALFAIREQIRELSETE